MANHPVDVHVGKKLRQRRTILGITQDSLAKGVGITSQQVQKYERGVNRMSASRLYEISKVLAVQIVYFFEGFKDEAARSLRRGAAYALAEEVAEFEQEALSSKDSLELIRIFYRVSDPKVKRKIVEMVRSIADASEVPSGHSRKSRTKKSA